MNRCYFAVLALLIAGCARRDAPAVAVLPTAKPIPTATPITVAVPAMPIQVTPTPDPIVSRELARLRTASPERDLEAAWTNKNTKFVAVRGVGWHLPGVPQERESDLLDKYDAVPIEGTTDFIYAPEIAQLNAAATKYATSYNQLLLQKLDEEQKAKVD